jgi:hypothetical protein
MSNNFFKLFLAEFHGIDTWMMKKALSVLESKGKAQMFEAPDSTDESGLGVKFYN